MARKIRARRARRPQLPPRKRRSRNARAGGSRAVDPFVHCVLGPVNQAGMGDGVPDGSTEPSVVVEHRQALTITASSGGNVNVAIVGSVYGAIGLDEGTAKFMVNSTNTTGDPPFVYGTPASVTATLTSEAWGTGIDNQHYSLVPFNESIGLTGSLTDQNASGLQATKFRVLTTQAKISYTGTSLANSGVSATAKLPLKAEMNMAAQCSDDGTAFQQTLQYGSPLPQPLPVGFSAVAALPGSRVFPVTENVTIMLPAECYDYQDLKNSWTPYFSNVADPLTSKDLVFAGIMQVTEGGGPSVDVVAGDGCSGIGYAPVAFYSATGMAASQSVTIEVRSCIEYTLAFSSPSARFARVPPMERPLAIRQAKELARSMPSSFPTTAQSEESGWLGALSSIGRFAVKNAISLGSSFLPGGAAVSRLVPMLGDLAMGAVTGKSRLAIGM